MLYVIRLNFWKEKKRVESKINLIFLSSLSWTIFFVAIFFLLRAAAKSETCCFQLENHSRVERSLRQNEWVQFFLLCLGSKSEDLTNFTPLA